MANQITIIAMASVTMWMRKRMFRGLFVRLELGA
jgi:hypothetical protein